MNSRSIKLLADFPPVSSFDTVWSLSLGETEIELTEITRNQWAGNFPPNLAGTSQTLSIDMNPVGVRQPGFDPCNFYFPEVTFDNISFPSEVVSSVFLGDLDQNGSVNFGDISPFIDLLITGSYQAEADINEDEAVDFFDIQPFITALLAS